MKAVRFYTALILSLSLTVYGLTAGQTASSVEIFVEKNFRPGKPDRTDTQIYKAIAAIDSILFNHAGIQDRQKAELLCEKARLYKSRNYYSTAISLYDQAFALLEKQADTKEKQIDILLESSKLYEPYGDYSTGVEKLYMLLKLAGHDYPEKTASAYITLGHYYALLNDLRLAKENLDSAASRLNRIDTKDKDLQNELRYNLHNALAGIWSYRNSDSAFLHLGLAEQYSNRDIHKMQIIYQNRAVLYGYLKDYATAENFFQKSLVLIDDEFQKLCVFCNLAELENLRGNYDKALLLFQEALTKADQIPSAPIKVQALKSMADIYAQKHDFERSYKLLNESQKLADSSFLSDNKKRILTIQRDFELFKAENDKRLYDYQNEVSALQIFKKNILILLFSLGLAASIVIGLVIYRKFIRQRTRSDQLSNLLKTKISEDNRILENLREEADKKSRELVSNALAMAKASEVVSDILPQIEILRHQTKDPKSAGILSDIAQKIKSLDWDEKQWENFKLYFEQVHPSFFRNLNKAYPTLTAGENRICTFIVMNLNTKDIAILTNRSPRTIDTIKFRIRRKMNIPKDVSTLSFLLDFTKNSSREQSDTFS